MVDNVKVIEYDMLDKGKYFPLVALSGFTARSFLYPFMLIKTRLQVQKQNALYKGTFDAFNKILTREGVRGLYRGFWFQNFFFVAQMSYITTYEYVRNAIKQTPFQNDRLRSFIAGGCASMVGQTFTVPVDIVGQHLQMMNAKKSPQNNSPTTWRLSRGPALAVIKDVYSKYGIRGFYKGYLVTMAVYPPNSAVWWMSYQKYLELLSAVTPSWLPWLLIQSFVAAPLSGATCAVLFAFPDAVRTRVQVDKTKFLNTVVTLWKEEHLGIFTKGVTARLIYSSMFSVWIIFFYETIKRFSVLDQYKDEIKW